MLQNLADALNIEGRCLESMLRETKTEIDNLKVWFVLYCERWYVLCLYDTSLS